MSDEGRMGMKIVSSMQLAVSGKIGEEGGDSNEQ